MIQHTPFQVLRGGLAEDASSASKKFVSAYITDTRLMGVVALVLHWYLPQNQTKDHFYQFFYLDAEEYGFDTYRSFLVSADDEDAAVQIHQAEVSLMGGLGGRKNALSEREARAIVQHYVAWNRLHHIPLPGNADEYRFLLTPQVHLDDDETLALMKKQCPSIDSEFQVIHYFLMRCFGRDFEAAKFLTKHYVRTDLFPHYEAATLLLNSIEEAPDTNGSHTAYHATGDGAFGTFDTQKRYLCESLIECSGRYFLIITQITLEHLKVVRYEKVSSFRVSTTEAAMMTDRPEHITVFDCPPEYLENTLNFTPLLDNSSMTLHDNGRLFMIFYPHNNHVNHAVFRLSDDVFGVFYLADNGQILLSSGSRENLQKLEYDLMTAPVGNVITPLSRYRFQEPVLYEFVNSICEDFAEFVDLISAPDAESGSGCEVENIEDEHPFPPQS